MVQLFFIDNKEYYTQSHLIFEHYIQWRRIVETCRKIANVVGKLSRLLEIVKVVDGGGGEVVKI